MAESPLTAARIEALAADPAAYAPAAIADALARADHDDAVARAVARALAGAPLPIHELAPILPLAPGVLDLLYLVGAATGDRVETLLWLCEHERFPLDLEGLELEAAALWAVTRLGNDTAWPRVRRRVRRMQRYKLDALARSIVQLVADIVLPAGKGPRAAISPGLGHELERALAGPIAGYLDELPAQDEGARVVTGYTVRSGPKPGRNEPCPCGSGKKYKKCCMEKDEAGPAPSPVPGLSWDEYLREGAGKITADALRDLTTADLARVDLARLDDDPLVEALRTWIELRRFDLAERVLAVIDARASLADTRDDLRVELVEALVTARELDDARRVMAGLGDADAMAPGTRLFLELDAARPAAPDRLARIDAEARAALGDERGEAEVELAYALLDVAPALGVLVARGALRPDRALDSDTLLDAIEQTRIALDLPGGDRAWEAWAALDPRGAAARERRAQEALEELADEEAEEAAAEAASLRELLQAANARAADLERNLTASRARLEQQAPAPARAPDPEAERERRALREKIETLEARIREGNEERAEMRRALASTGRAGGERRGGPGRTAPTPERVDDDTRAAEEAAEAMAPPRGVLIPTFAAAFEAALAEVPAHVAAEAMRTIGGLAAGDPPAWRGVKQAQDIRPPLLMARVGIHHRLLFRAEERRLDLLDLVTREALMHTLKRLRR